jgi:hypothetical protein
LTRDFNYSVFLSFGEDHPWQISCPFCKWYIFLSDFLMQVLLCRFWSPVSDSTPFCTDLLEGKLHSWLLRNYKWRQSFISVEQRSCGILKQIASGLVKGSFSVCSNVRYTMGEFHFSLRMEKNRKGSW